MSENILRNQLKECRKVMLDCLPQMSIPDVNGGQIDCAPYLQCILNIDFALESEAKCTMAQGPRDG